jgi:hypothetical protein
VDGGSRKRLGSCYGAGCSASYPFSTIEGTGNASVVVTQIESHAFFILWNVARQRIVSTHDVTAIPVFTAETLIGVDILHLSPSLDALRLMTAEIDVPEAFAAAGGRLIIPADNGV